MLGPGNPWLDPRYARMAAMASVIPMLMVAGPLVGWYLGGLIGRPLGYENPARFVGLILGIGSSIRQVWQMIKSIQEEKR